MTQFYYLSAKQPLDTGTFGEVKKLSNKGNYTFETAVDEASITIEKLQDGTVPNLSYPYQYEVMAHLGDFGVNKDHINELDRKCLKTLFHYLKAALDKSFIVEFYTAWAGEEELEAAEVKELTMDELAAPDQLKLKNRSKLVICRQKY
ncbi:hypothetical protein [Bacillus badius]|uniref:Phage protein n=1 Tax=Bacillus badius TaxID=1455 RepID=A0ABR5AU91_BACBA|nr:hypothetical protein [Bacillus badius]KIL72777.1 hypothetical protein SD78_3948 [Bacillus badius]KIL78204.1 hypothetical protein SD77_0805 [Bacillus badius]KZR57006.1 hypothetical protein A3781_04890 [Bacillus badius]MED4718307.1 hypothetical protein [Bacillus badius]